MAVRDLCGGWHLRRDAQQNASGSRYDIAELFANHARSAGARGRTFRSDSLGDHRAGDELVTGAPVDAAFGALSRHWQSWLFHYQAGLIAAGRIAVDPRPSRSLSSGPGSKFAMSEAMLWAMPWFGLSLLVLVGLGVVFTGIPAAIVLLAAACFGAVVGALSGAVPVQLLGVLPERLINLLENDLLQAIPLYVLMGALINRLPLADALYRCGLAIVPEPAAPVVSGLTLGALLGPMNGSVGASVLALARVAEPRLAASGISLPRRAAIITVASTLGVVVPPSLVLILLGDAMLNAHTIAVTATGREDRVINTQDVFHGALVPAALYLAACLFIGWWFNRRAKPEDTALPAPVSPPTLAQAILAAMTVLAILILLGGVTAGYFYAVEAGAIGASGSQRNLARGAGAHRRLVFSFGCRNDLDPGVANPRHRLADRQMDRRHSGRSAQRDGHRACRYSAQRPGARRLRDHFRGCPDYHTAAPRAGSGCALGRRSRPAGSAGKLHQSVDRLCRHDDPHRSKAADPIFGAAARVVAVSVRAGRAVVCCAARPAAHPYR